MARRSAREIAALKLKLAEKEAQLMGGFGSSANLVLGELPGGVDGGGDDFGLGGVGGGLGGSAAPSRDVSVRSLRLPPRAPTSARRLSPRLDPLASAEAGGGGGGGGAAAAAPPAAAAPAAA